MTLFSIHAPPLDGEPVEAVADRFSWLAALLPPFYLLAHGLWLAVLGFVVAVALIAAAGLWLGGEVAVWLYLLLALLIGLEAGALRRAKLARLGFSHRAERFAPGADEAAALGPVGRSGS